MSTCERACPGSLLVAAVVLAACAPPTVAHDHSRPPEPATAHGPDTESAAPQRTAPLAERLQARTVTDHDFARRRLYTWTSPAQVEQLRDDHVLLRARPNTGGVRSPYTRLVAALAPSDPVAALLHADPRLTARRYAWPSPFATVLGRGPSRYGTALIAIELRDDAFIGRLDPLQDPPFAFVDTRGATVATADVMRAPERLGAMFHVRTEPGTPARFREYIVCNEAMVGRWEVATEAIADRIADEIELLEALAQGPFARLPRAQQRWPASPRWSRTPDVPTFITRWHAALAFDNVRYRPTPQNLHDAIAALRSYRPAGSPLVVDHTRR